MDKVNPKKLSWNAPETNEDGTPITYELEYELGVYDEAEQDFIPKLTVAGQLRDDTEGEYEAQIELMEFDTGEHKIALRAFAKDDPNRKSVWSESATFAISDEIPSAPKGLSVT